MTICDEPKLLRRPRPKIGESFMGFLVRDTEENGYKTPAAILGLAQIKRHIYYAENSTYLKMPVNLKPLSRLTGVKESELRSLLHKKRGERSELSPFGQIIPKYMIRFSKAKYCPECLIKDNYYRSIWDVAPVTACPIHGCLMYDECPNCWSPVNWARGHVSLCERCDYDFRTAPPIRVKKESLALTKCIYSLCGILPDSINLDKSGNPLYAMDLANVLMVVFFVAGQLAGMTETTGKVLAANLRNVDLHHNLSEAFSIFDNWPNNFYGFLDSIRNRLIGSEYSTGLNHDFGTFHSNLAKRFSDCEFHLIREAYETYLTNQWDGGYISARCRLLSKQNNSHNRYVTKEKAQKILRVKEQKIDSLLKSGELTGVLKQMKTRTMFLIDKRSVERLKKEYEKYMDLQETAELLGIGDKLVIQLSCDKILTSIDGPIMGGARRWLYKKEGIESFLLKFGEHIKDMGDSSPKITLQSSIRRLTGSKLGLVDLVRAVFSGEVRPCGKGIGKGLAGYLFYYRDITDLLRRKKKKERGNLFTVVEAARMLGLKEQVLYFLLEKEIVCAEPSARRKLGFALLHIDSIKSFEATYTTISVLAKKHKTSPKNLVKLLIQRGISPVSGPSYDNGRQYIFRKADIEEVSFMG